ncbi:MAG: hypothetical protein KME04_20465 [Pleurocapsa minor GSE-CHR-MK-17-07R]|nr:hypothetical protein [Pleurocapsa minor GSE-CHR-MK 17-07R]
MKSLRKFLLGGMAAAALVLALPAAAQENTFGLSEADWALFTAAQGSAPESFSYEFASMLSLESPGAPPVAWDLTGSGLVLSDGFSMDVSGTLTTDTGDLPAALNVRVTDGGLYFSLDGTQWIGGTQEEITEMASGLAGSMLPVDPNALMNDPDAMNEAMGELMAQPGMMEAFMGISTLDPNAYVSIVRNADDAGFAYFTTVLDLGGLISSPALTPLLVQAVSGTTGMDASTMTPEQIEQMGPMLAGMFAGSNVMVEQWVDASTGALARTQLNVFFNANQGDQQLATVGLTFDIRLADAAGATIEAPAEFQPLSAAMGMLMGGMGAMGQ